MSKNMLVRGAAVAGIAVCALAVGGGVAFAAEGDGATACVNGATNYPDCTPSTPGTTTGNGPAVGPGNTPTGDGVVTVVAGGTGVTEAGGAASSLPFTGFEAGAAAAIGLAALGAGTIFIVGSRRRRSSGDSAAA